MKLAIVVVETMYYNVNTSIDFKLKFIFTLSILQPNNLPECQQD